MNCFGGGEQTGRARVRLGRAEEHDRDIVPFAVKKDVFVIQYASAELKNDRDIVLFAVKKNRFVIRYASDELRKNRESCGGSEVSR